MKVKQIIAGIILAGLFLSLNACGLREKEKPKLKVIYAGSLIQPLEEASKQFNKLYPEVKVETEGHGSIQVIRYVTDLGKKADVLLVADYSLISSLMYDDYANWYIKFATNQLVIAYTEKSKYAAKINSANWYEILSLPEVKFGLAHPLLDACGYRSLMAIQLAELYYQKPNIFKYLIANNFDPSVKVQKDDGNYTIFIPEVIKPLSQKVSLRGGSIQVLALLDAGLIDYAFEYRSVALQHGLKFVELPPQINLSSPVCDDFYRQVKVNFGFQRFSAIGNEQAGKVIFYGLTIPKNARDPLWAEEYVKFILGPEGKKIFTEHEHPVIPPEADNLYQIPPALAPFIKKEKTW